MLAKVHGLGVAHSCSPSVVTDGQYLVGVQTQNVETPLAIAAQVICCLLSATARIGTARLTLSPLISAMGLGSNTA